MSISPDCYLALDAARMTCCLSIPELAARAGMEPADASKAIQRMRRHLSVDRNMMNTLFNHQHSILNQIVLLIVLCVFASGCKKTTTTEHKSLKGISIVYSNASHMVCSYKLVPRANERLEIILGDDQQSVISRSFVEKFSKDQLRSLAKDAMNEMVKYKAIRDAAVPTDLEVLSLVNKFDGTNSECQIVGSRKQHLEFYITTKALLKLLHLASNGQPKACQIVYYSLVSTNNSQTYK